jgi:hypothetical protein
LFWTCCLDKGAEEESEVTDIGLLILIAIPTAMYFAIVAMAKADTAARRARDRIRRIQRDEEVKQLKW